MLALVVVANPNPDSFSHALARTAAQAVAARGFELASHDLHAERFDPVQPTGELLNVASDDDLVERHCADLRRADLILVFHPNWWGQPPAIMKGWIDRVFRLNTAYDYPEGVGPEGVPRGLLRARHALVINTSNTPAEREAAAFGDPLQVLWEKCVFGLCGVDSVVRRTYAPMASSTPGSRAHWLRETGGLAAGLADSVLRRSPA
jgi:NAD(P)H dehydrogenase (quinone)